jgi:hypothetical protein
MGAGYTMMKLFLSLILILIAFPLYANPCMQIVMGGSSDTAAPPAACETQTTPNDMETSASSYLQIGNSSATKYVSSKIVADATTGTVCRLCLSMNKVQTPPDTMDFSVQLWANKCTTCDRSDDVPDKDNILDIYGSMRAIDIAGTFGDCFSLGSVTFNDDDIFHVVIIADEINATNYFRWVLDSTCTNKDMKRSADGTTWAVYYNTVCGMVKLYTEAP